MPADRMKSVNSTIQKELSNIFIRDLFPSFTCLITLKKVETTVDLRQCKVFVSIMGSSQEKKKVISYLESHSQEYYTLLGKRLRMKFVPKILFVLDEEDDRVQAIHKLLDNLTYSDQ